MAPIFPNFSVSPQQQEKIRGRQGKADRRLSLNEISLEISGASLVVVVVVLVRT